MADLQGMLDRQTSKVEELRQQAEQEPSVASLQALASIYRSRAETLTSLGETERAREDLQTAVGLLAQLVIGAGRSDLLETLVDAGEGLRAALTSLGRADEAFDNALGETQLIGATGQTARAAAALRKMADERKSALAGEATPQRLEQVVKALSLLAGTQFQAQRMHEALEAETEAIDLVTAFQPPQPEFIASLRANRALTRAALGQSALALAEIDEVIAAFDQLLAQRPDAALLASAVDARSRKAQLLLQQEKVDDGLQILEEAVAFAASHVKGGEPEGALLHRRALKQLAEAARMAGQYDRAMAAADQWNGLLEPLANAAQGGPGSLELVEEILDAAYERALLHHALNRYDLALDGASQIASTWNQIARSQPERIDWQHRLLMALDLRERSLTALGRDEEAVQDQSTLIEGYQALLSQGAPPQLIEGLLVTLQRRAETLRKLGRHQEAQKDQAFLRQILQQIQGGPAEEPTKQGPGPIIL